MALVTTTLERRHVTANGNRTCIALEVAFWIAMEQKACGWQAWAMEQLQAKPPSIGRARWLRVKLLEDLAGC